MFFKLFARQFLGIDLLKFSGDVKKWPTVITMYRRTAKDCENMECLRIRKCLLDPSRNCVRMILLTNNAERAIAILERIMVALTRSSNS
jgi:hypothetical protein